MNCLNNAQPETTYIVDDFFLEQSMATKIKPFVSAP